MREVVDNQTTLVFTMSLMLVGTGVDYVSSSGTPYGSLVICLSTVCLSEEWLSRIELPTSPWQGDMLPLHHSHTSIVLALSDYGTDVSVLTSHPR